MAADDEIIVISDSETDGDVHLVAELEGHVVQHPLTRAAAQAQHSTVQQADPDAVQPQLAVVSAAIHQEQKPLPALSPQQQHQLQQQQQQQHLTPQKQPQQQSRTPKSKGAAAAGFTDAQLQRQQSYMQAFLHPMKWQPLQQTHAIQHQQQEQEPEQEQQSALQMQSAVASNGVQQRPIVLTRPRRPAAILARQAIALKFQAEEQALLGSQQDRLSGGLTQQQQQQQPLSCGLEASAHAADQQLAAAKLAQAAWGQRPVAAAFQPPHSTQPCVQQGALEHLGQLRQVQGGCKPQLFPASAAAAAAPVGVGGVASHVAVVAGPAAKRLRLSMRTTVNGLDLEAEYMPAAAAPGERRAPIAAELTAAALPALPDYSWQAPAPGAAHMQLTAADTAHGGAAGAAAAAAAGGAVPGVLDSAASEDLSLDLQGMDGQWQGFGQQDHLQQQQQQQAEELPRPAFGGAQACNDDQYNVPTAELGDKFKVWPDVDVDDSNSSTAGFDLVPSQLCSPGVQPFMQLLMLETQPPPPRVKAAAAHAGRGKRGQQGLAKQATKAAAANAAQQPAAAVALPGLTSSVFDSVTAAAAVGTTAGTSYDETDPAWYDWETGGFGSQEHGGFMLDEQGSGAVGSSGASGVAGCADGGAEAAWYADAAQQGLKFTWADAPRGRFYSVESVVKARHKAESVVKADHVYLVPHLVITRQDLDSQLWHLAKRTRVVQVKDTCHPCIHNPVRPATLPPGEHYMLVAARDLQADELLGLYWGNVMTVSEDQAASAADLTCRYGLKHAYNMTVAWSKDKVDSEGELIVAGDDSNCRMCLINDVKSWAREMEAKGWGPCPCAAAGTCTCSRYMDRAANVKWLHLVYRGMQGDYYPAIAVYTKTPAVEGDEILTSYEDGSTAFWDAIRCNVTQRTYCCGLEKKSQGTITALQSIMELIKKQPPSALGQRIHQLAAGGLQVAQEEEQQLSLLLAEAAAAAQGSCIPQEVVAARRRAVGTGP